MVEIIPAILPKSLEELQEGLARLRGLAPLVQVDLVGKNILANEEGFPLWEEFDFECDIMLPDALAATRRCIELGASRIVVHADAANAREALSSLQELRGGEYPVAAGVALRADDTLEALAALGGLYDFVQVMGIQKVGFQGQPFDERALALISQLHSTHPELAIQVDGGVRIENVPALIAAGATRLVVGSLILKSDNPKEIIREILTIADR